MQEKTEDAAQILSLPIGPRVVEAVGVAYRARRPTLLEGPTGVGKSEIVAQAAEALEIQLIILDLSLLEPPDLVGLPVFEKGRTTYAPPEILPTGGAGILMLEELNRAERYIQQPALQLLTARRLHTYELPDGWCTCAAINPENEDYQVTPLDPALRSRFLNLVVNSDRSIWIDWAAQNAVHPAVLDVARTHDRFLETIPPRTWKYVSDLLHTVTLEESRNAVLISDLLGGYLPPSLVRLVKRSFDRADSGLKIDIVRMIRDYDLSRKRNTLRAKLLELRDRGRTDLLDQITHQVLSVLQGPQLQAMIARQEFKLSAFEKMLMDLPGDHRERLQEELGHNPMAADLLEVKPLQILNGYRGSALSRKIDRWLRDASKLHRVLLLASSLRRHVECLKPGKELNRIRNSNGARGSLGRFLTQIGPRWGKPLKETLSRLDITPLGCG